MNPIIKKHYLLIHEVILKSQDEILAKTGVTVQLFVREFNASEKDILLKKWQPFLNTWQVSIEDIRDGGREESLPVMRKILWMYARINFKKISLIKIGELLGVRDHTTVLKGVNSAYDFLHVQDEYFLRFYNPVKHLFNEPVDATI